MRVAEHRAGWSASFGPTETDIVASLGMVVDIAGRGQIMEPRWMPPNKFRCYAEELAGVLMSVISPAFVQDRSSGGAVIHVFDTTARDDHHLLEGELT